MAADKKNLLLLFDRPQEPVFMEKGEEGAVFDVPENYLTERYRPIGIDVANRFGSNAKSKIPVSTISVPSLKIPMSVARDEHFSLFIPKHRAAASRLVDIFLGMRSLDDLMSCAVYARDRVNPYLFNYAYSVALLHRPDTKDLPLPLFVETFPDKFMDSKVFARIREEANVVTDESRMPIVIPRDYTASDLDEEHRLWYFREDMGLNLHHWHWHLVYPFVGDRTIVAKDRRGELFYYMHQQVIARYNFERFSNLLPRVKRFNNFREPIKEAYFPKMDSLVASRAWPGRVENMVLKDLNRELDQVRNDVSDLERWRDRIFDAIHQKSAVDENGRRIPLDEVTGIDTLGNIIEASILSPNRQLYGDLHNFGHVFVSFVNDPDHRNLESFGVMGDPATACRDPMFYLWHAFIDDVFQEHKELLTPYTTQQLDFSGIQITDVKVQPESNGQVNTFQTFWQQSDINLSRGMDFVPRGNVFARFTHLQHTPFTYTIQINNTSGAQTRGTLRIFLGPKFDERGTEMLFRDQRKLMIELDRAFIQMNPGMNMIRRRSGESNVSIPFERTFRNLDLNRPNPGTVDEAAFNFCGCGWPEHLLIPKGTPDGLQCQLFVMISNYADDVVESSPRGTCNDAAAYCGVRDSRYPDRRAMGFPFDRNNRPGADRLATFVRPNMTLVDCTIRHTNEIRTRKVN